MKLPPGYVPGSGAQKATAYGGFGEKLMKHMGWEDGQGLGRDKQGMRKAIEVKLKEDTVGVGGKSTYAWEKKWWEDAFNARAQAVEEADSGSSDSSDDELSLPANRDGTQSSAHAHELRIAAALAKDPWGRFGGRDGKMARIKAQEAASLTALRARAQSGAAASTSTSASSGSTAHAAGSLGNRQHQKASGQGRQVADDSADAGPRAAEVNAQVLEAKSGRVNDAGVLQQPKAKRRKALKTAAAPGSAAGIAAEASELAPEAQNKQVRKRARAKAAAGVAGMAVHGRNASTAGQVAGAASEPQQVAERREVFEVLVQPTAGQEAFTPTARSGWWGARRFRSAGCLEGLEHTAEHVARRRQTFTEGTQEGLYTAAQAAKTANKKGLGSASALKKVGGTRWKGVRTVIEEPDQKAATSSAPATGAAEECLSLSSIKWRKLATGMLQQVPGGGIAMKKLSQRLVKAAVQGSGQSPGKAARKALQQDIVRKITHSARFIVEGNTVRLKS